MHSTSDTCLQERFKALRKVLGMTQRQIGEAIGGSLRTWQNYEIGRSSPNWRALESLVDMRVNVNWLLTGEGHMFSGSVHDGPDHVAEDAAPYDTAADHRHLPLIDASHSNTVQTSNVPFVFDAAFLKQLSGTPSALRLYRVPEGAGSSYIADGRFVVVDTSRTGLSAGGYYVLKFGADYRMMLVQRDHIDNVYLHSGNQHYREIAVDATDIDTLNVIGRAIWADRML